MADSVFWIKKNEKKVKIVLRLILISILDYLTYVQQIEKEYCHMSDEAFNQGRSKVISSCPLPLYHSKGYLVDDT